MKRTKASRSRLVFGAILTGNAGILAACAGGSLPPQGTPEKPASSMRDAVLPAPTPTYGILTGTPKMITPGVRSTFVESVWQTHGSSAYTGPFTINVYSCNGYATVSPSRASLNAGLFTVYAGAMVKSCDILVTGAAGKMGEIPVEIHAAPTPTPTPMPSYGPVNPGIPGTVYILEKKTAVVSGFQQTSNGPYTGAFSLSLGTCWQDASAGPARYIKTYPGNVMFSVTAGVAPLKCQVYIVGGGGQKDTQQIDIIASPTPTPTIAPTPTPSPTPTPYSTPTPVPNGVYGPVWIDGSPNGVYKYPPADSNSVNAFVGTNIPFDVHQMYGSTFYTGAFSINTNTCALYVTVSSVAAIFTSVSSTNVFTLYPDAPGACDMIITGGGGVTENITINITP